MFAEGLAAVVASAQLPVPETDADQARRLAEEILDGSEYRNQQGLIGRILGWISDHISSALSSVGGGGAGSAVAVVILVAALGAILWLVVRYAGSIRSLRQGGGRARIATTSVERAEQAPTHDWRAASDQLEADGALDDAMVARYRAVVVDLIDAGVLPDVAGRTSGEFRSDVHMKAPAAGPDFASFTDRFESIWYGPADAEPGDLAAMRAADSLIVAAVRGATAASLDAGSAGGDSQ